VYQAPREKCLQNGPKSTGCETVEKYSLTYRVWDNGNWCKFNEPMPNPNLALFEATNHAYVLVEYDAFSEKHSAVKRCAYFLVCGMVFSDDSKRLAYGGRRGNKFFLVVDGKQGTDYDALGYFGFSQDGKHRAFTAKKGDKAVIVVDGKERATYDSVPAGPVFRADGVLEFLAANRPSLYRIEVTDF